MGTREDILERWNSYFDDELQYIARDDPQRFADFVLDGTVPFEGQLICEDPP